MKGDPPETQPLEVLGRENIGRETLISVVYKSFGVSFSAGVDISDTHRCILHVVSSHIRSDHVATSHMSHYISRRHAPHTTPKAIERLCFGCGPRRLSRSAQAFVPVLIARKLKTWESEKGDVAKGYLRNPVGLCPKATTPQ